MEEPTNTLQSKKALKNKYYYISGFFLIVILLVLIYLFFIKKGEYEQGVNALSKKEYTEAKMHFERVKEDNANYQNAQKKILYIDGLQMYNDKQFNLSYDKFKKIMDMGLDKTDPNYTEIQDKFQLMTKILGVDSSGVVKSENKKVDLEGIWDGEFSGYKFRMVIKTINNSVKGYNTVEWPQKKVTENFSGTVDWDNKTIKLYEQEGKGAGVFDGKYSDEGSKMEGIWTRNKDGGKYNWTLQKASGEINLTSTSPDEVIDRLIDYIDRYGFTRNESFIRKAYNLWSNPESSIGSFQKFKDGFANTLSDQILSIETLSNDGINSTIQIEHEAKELANEYMNADYTIQWSKYEGTYQLINVNGQWKIKSGKFKLISRN